MNNDTILEPGTQICYCPPHAKGDVNHKDSEWGFSQEDRGATALCRFWKKNGKGKNIVGDLRTAANAESAYKRDLVLHQHCEQRMIDTYLRIRVNVSLERRRMWGMPVGARTQP